MASMRQNRKRHQARFLTVAVFLDPFSQVPSWNTLFELAYGDIRSHQHKPCACGKGTKEPISLHDGAPVNGGYHGWQAMIKASAAKRRQELKKQVLMKKHRARLRRMGIR